MAEVSQGKECRGKSAGVVQDDAAAFFYPASHT